MNSVRSTVESRHCLEKKYRINIGLVALQMSMGIRCYYNVSFFRYRVRTQTGMVLFIVSYIQCDISRWIKSLFNLIDIIYTFDRNKLILAELRTCWLRFELWKIWCTDRGDLSNSFLLQYIKVTTTPLNEAANI